MADIRIKDLANTATSAASDDYLALDGSANGTRKILATNVAQNVTDVTFGSSGPSAKSSIAARAARQGLVFDGTSNATIANVSAFGTGDFTVGYVGVFSALSGYQRVIGRTLTNGLYFGVKNQNPVVAIEGSVEHLTSTASLTVNKASHVVYVRQSGQGTFYVNGVAAGTGSDALNYSGAIDKIASASEAAKSVSGIVAYNRALSAAEVVSLYESGVPAGSDYTTPAAGQSLLNSTGWTVNIGTPTVVSASAVTFTTAGSQRVISSPSFTYRAGTRVRVTGSCASFSGTQLQVYLGGGSVETITANGAFSFVLDDGTPGTQYVYIANDSGGGGGIITSLAVHYLGLLLAPDAAQAGGGLVWYDTSGNAANISWTSGVSWNVPTSGKMSGLLEIKTVNNTYSGGALKITDQLGNSTFITRANGTTYISADGTTDHFLLSSSGAGTFAGNLTVSGTGNSSVAGKWLLGTGGVDSGALLQVGTNTSTSSGGMVFGTNAFLFRTTTGGIALSDNGTRQTNFYCDSGGSYIGSNDTRSLFLRTNNTTALTLDSSQRCILAGALRLNNAYVSGAPTATGYVTLQDSAGNTYKVLVGT